MGSMQANPASRQIARAAGTVAAAMIISQLIGLLRGILIYRTFGTTADLDSFNAANRVTEVLFNLMAGGALGSAFIPTFTGLLARQDQQRAWKLAAAIGNLLLLALSGVVLLATIFAPQIVRHGLFVLAPGLSAGQELLTIRLMRIMLPSVVIFGLSGLIMGVLNAHRVFWMPALAPAMYSIGMILGVVVFPAGWGIDRLAWGALLGSGLHLLVQLPGLIKLKGHYSLTLGRGVPEVGEVMRLMGPRILGVAVVQINFIVNTIIALSLPEGSVSAVTLAFALMLMPQAAIAQSLAIAAMPTFSAQAALGKLDELRAAFAATLRGALLLAVPAAVGIIILRQPIIRMLYERGEFTSHSTDLVTWALLWYAIGLIGHTLVEITSRAFYALHNTKTPVMVGIVAMGLNLVFSLTLPAGFSRVGWLPHGGLALANTLATAAEAAALLILLRRQLQGLDGRAIGQLVLQAGLAAAVMSLGLILWTLSTRNAPDGIQAVGGIAVGCLLYGLLLWLQRVRELSLVIAAVRRRLPGRFQA